MAGHRAVFDRVIEQIVASTEGFNALRQELITTQDERALHDDGYRHDDGHRPRRPDVSYDYLCRACDVRGTSPDPIPACWCCGQPATTIASLLGRQP